MNWDLQHLWKAKCSIPIGLQIHRDRVPIALIPAISPREADPLLPKHLHYIGPISQPTVVAPRPSQPNTRYIEVLLQQLVGLAHLLARFIQADATHHPD